MGQTEEVGQGGEMGKRMVGMRAEAGPRKPPVLLGVSAWKDRGTEGQSASEPPCLGTERYVLSGQNWHFLAFNFRFVSIWGSEQPAESLEQGRVGIHLAFVVGQGFFLLGGTKAHRLLLPAPAAQTSPRRSPHPRVTLRTKAPEHLLLSGIPQDHP